MKYTAKFFRDTMPEWKRKKDSFLARKLYRPLSFFGASFAANLGVSANQVSYFSAVLGFVACCLFLPNSFVCHVIGAVLINIWTICDCIDGNIARSIESQPFGEFADGISSYILAGLMCTMMSIPVYLNGGLIVPKGTLWIVVIGALASSSDSLMRLIYQKYKNSEIELVKKGLLVAEQDDRMDHEKVRSLKVRLELELGLGGIIPPAILLASIFGFLDIVIIYCFFYYGGACLITTLTYIRKAIKANVKRG